MKALLLPVAGLILGITLLGSGSALAQFKVKGRVLDRINKEVLDLASVRDVGDSRVTMPDRKGDFIFDCPSEDSVTLLVSFIGYESRQVRVKPGSLPVVVEMEKGAINMKEFCFTAHTGNRAFTTMSRIDLNMQPTNSAQDLLRLVPGLFIAQHQGGGKAEQIFLRGFDADHGTDVNISVDGMPVNMPSHAHGQGYADLHFLIPETIADYDFGKGPYYTSKGDFTTAGYVAYNTKNVLDHNVFALEGGQFSTGHALAMINLVNKGAEAGGVQAYVAGDGLYSNGNGPFILPEHFHRLNLFGKFTKSMTSCGKLSISLSTMTTSWRAAGEIPNRAVTEGYIPSRWDALDSAQGGFTARSNVNIKLTTFLSNGYTLENQAWYSHYAFNLVSNFTFFYYYPTTGDEFRQAETRDLAGYNSKISKSVTVGDATFSSTAGASWRFDHIYPSELAHTENGQFLEYLQLGRTREGNLNGYAEETVTGGKWLINVGARIDYLHFYYKNLAPEKDSIAAGIYNGVPAEQGKAAISPKLNIEYTFNPKFQLYLKSGKGFHSNDARVVIANRGSETLPAAYGADLGANWKPKPRLFINAAFWWLYLQQEFTFGQDLIDQAAGPVQPSGKTRRLGVDLSARYQFCDWLFGSLNANIARPRFIDSAAHHTYIPLAPTLTSTAALNFKCKNGLNGALSYRYLHDRAANSTYSLTALGYWIADATLNYTQSKYEVGLSIQNLFNQSWAESQFEYVSRLKYETAPVDEVSYTPGTPFFLKLRIAVFF